MAKPQFPEVEHANIYLLNFRGVSSETRGVVMKKVWLFIATIVVTSNAFALRVETPATVVVRQTLTDAALYGGCMARLSYDLSASGLACSKIVTFDCLNSVGTTSKSAAERMFAQAQLAMVAGRYVKLVVDDSVKVNGQCFAERIDVLGPTP